MCGCSTSIGNVLYTYFNGLALLEFRSYRGEKFVELATSGGKKKAKKKLEEADRSFNSAVNNKRKNTVTEGFYKVEQPMWVSCLTISWFDWRASLPYLQKYLNQKRDTTRLDISFPYLKEHVCFVIFFLSLRVESSTTSVVAESFWRHCTQTAVDIGVEQLCFLDVRAWTRECLFISTYFSLFVECCCALLHKLYWNNKKRFSFADRI